MLNIEHSLRKLGKATKISPGTVTTIVALVVTTVVILAIPALPAESDNQGTTVEGFTLFRYGDQGDDLFWKLTGKTGKQTDRGLLVQDFNLEIRTGDSKDSELISKFSGRRLKLQEVKGGQVAIMPGEIDINIENRLKGIARSVRYDFSKGRVTGESLELTQSRDGGKITLTGSRFEYLHESEELILEGGFEANNYHSDGELTEIEGDKLTWPSGERITMSGNITASLPSGWNLRAERMLWNPDEALLESSGSASASRENTRIEGEEITYDQDDEEVSVKNGKIVKKGE